MKHSLTAIIFLFTLMFSSTSHADWTKIEGVDGPTFYVDYERIRKHEGYVYYWYLTDFLEPNQYGRLSGKTYIQGDCKLIRFKALSFSFHNEPMGGGIGEVSEPKGNIGNWRYPPPNTVHESMLQSVCNR